MIELSWSMSVRCEDWPDLGGKSVVCRYDSLTIVIIQFYNRKRSKKYCNPAPTIECYCKLAASVHGGKEGDQAAEARPGLVGFNAEESVGFPVAAVNISSIIASSAFTTSQFSMLMRRLTTSDRNKTRQTMTHGGATPTVAISIVIRSSSITTENRKYDIVK